MPAGAAATYGDGRISEADLNAQVREVLAAQGKPLDTSDPGVAAGVLRRMLTEDLVDMLAASVGVTINQGSIDGMKAQYISQAGSEEAFNASLAQQGVAPSQIDDAIKLNLQAQALGMALDPSGTPETQGQAVFSAVGGLSDELGVEISPRYGSWDPMTVSIGPAIDDVATLPSAG